MRGVRRGGRLAVVAGEAGIGKTRLVDAALEAARAAGLTVLAAKAEELDAHRPFAAITDLLPFSWAELADELRPDVGPEQQYRVAATVVDRIEERSPLVLAVEDLHWADPATLGVLARVAREIENLPVALLVSARPAPRRPGLERLLAILDERGATVVELGPLSATACVELLEGLVGARAGTRLAGQARRAGGNPLFVCELVAALEASGAITRSGGAAEVSADGAMPTLPLTILHRLSFLPSDSLDVLGLAAVLGATFSATDLALLAGRPVSALLPALRAAQRAGVIGEQGDRLAFRHELIRDALYDDMPLSVRRGLHAQFATMLADAGAPPERVAEHVLRGAAAGDERAAAALVDAARALVGRGPGVAVDLYRSAIALAPDPDAARARLLPELAEALVSAGLLGEGEAACREVLARDLDPAWAGRLRRHLVLLLTRRGRIADAITEGLAGLKTPALSDRDRVELEGWVAMSRVFAGDVAAGVSEATSVLERSDDELSVALANNALAMAADARGAFAEAAEVIGRSVRWADASDSRLSYESRAHMIRGLMLARLDRLDDARATFQCGLRGAERWGMADAVPVFHYQLAFTDFLCGRLDDALAELATHDRLAAGTDIGWLISTYSLKALIALHQGDLLAAERYVAVAEREAAAGAPPFATDRMVLARGRLLEATGDVAAGLAAVAGTFDAMAAAGAATFLPALGCDLARLAVAAGQPERAAGAVGALEAIAALNAGVASLEAYPLQARGLLAGDGEALVAAARRLGESGRVLEAGRAAEDAAAAVGGDHARELLEGAREIYERSGAAHDLAHVDSALRALGVRRGAGGARRRPRSGWEALTDTELKVVRFVAERLTNPEIAERMFISRRTVQTHVSHALAKLGVTSRRDLAAEAARRAGWRLRIEGVGEQPQQPEPALEVPPAGAVDGHDA